MGKFLKLLKKADDDGLKLKQGKKGAKISHVTVKSSFWSDA